MDQLCFGATVDVGRSGMWEAAAMSKPQTLFVLFLCFGRACYSAGVLLLSC